MSHRITENPTTTFTDNADGRMVVSDEGVNWLRFRINGSEVYLDSNDIEVLHQTLGNKLAALQSVWAGVSDYLAERFAAERAARDAGWS